jgi:gamma-glutamyltranspeptidase/glutathione hydrolase
MTDRPMVPAPLARGSRGAVVAPHHLATTTGLGVLARGGSAVDAAIATNAVLGVVMPSGCGIGGDAFWLVWDQAERRLAGLNGSGRAPAGIDPVALRADGLEQLPRRGPLSVTVPGAVRSWGDAHRRWGRLSRDEVLADAIELASGGFPAGPGFSAAVEATAPVVDAVLGPVNGFRQVYRPLGRPWRPGERVRLPALAQTLRRLADEGFDALYDGELGERQAEALRAVGGAFSAPDFRDHRSSWTEPLVAGYRGVLVATHPPNSSGIVGLQILRLLETFEPPAAERFGARGWTDPRWLHLGIEAAKLALVERDREVGDPDAEPVDVAGMLDPARIADLARSIDPGRARRDLPPVRTLVSGTIYLAVVDSTGGAVSLIQSNAAGFGSGIVDPVTGIHYQSRGASFSLVAGHRNELAPGRRPLHSLLPAMSFRQDGTDSDAAAGEASVSGATGPWVVHGSMGGDVQPQILAQVVSALVDGRADVATAVAAPRWSVGPAGDVGPPLAVEAEGRIDGAVVSGLEALGHAVTVRPPFDAGFGHAHAIELIDGGPAAGGTVAAATDPRSEGLPAAR